MFGGVAMPGRSLFLACALVALSLVSSCSSARGPAPANPLPASCQELKPQDSAVVAWLGKQAVRLRSVEPGTDLKDLAPLKASLKGVQLVALGEATHGTREFSTAKHRLLQFLVQEMGVRTVLWELNYDNVRPLEDYIQGGRGGVRDALVWMYEIWHTEEVAAMVEWLRTYNLSVPPEQRVHVIGFDVQAAPLSAQAVAQYLQKAAPAFAPGVSDILKYAQLTDYERVQPDAQTAQRLADLRGIGTYLTEHQQELVAASSIPEFQQALLEAHIVARYFELQFTTPRETHNATRDRLMAETALEELQGREGLTALWAHNLHIFNDTNWMGSYLRQELGDRYYALGLTMGQGGVTARGIRQGESDGTPGSWKFDAAPAGQLEWYFACAGLGNSYVNWRGSGLPGDVAAWLKEPRDMWLLGWGYPIDGQFALTYRLPPAAFDGMVYMPAGTASRPLQ